ncbi:MAG: dipeptidase [Pseudomonadota bacterium]
MRRLVKWLLALLVVAAVGFFSLMPGVVERSLNRMVPADLPTVTDAAKALHQDLFVADMHADTLLWQRSMLDAADRGHVDLPRLQKGNVGLQVFSSVTKSPKGLNYESNPSDSDMIGLLAFAQLQPPRTWTSLLERSLWHAEKMHAAAEDADALMVIKTQSDIRALIAARSKDGRIVGGMLSIEGLHNLEADADNLQRLFDAGFRMAGLTHFFDNALAGSMHGEVKGGLTPFGRDIVEKMEAMGMIVDIAHLSVTGVDDVLAMATKPVVVSHGGVKSLCDRNRNLTDDQIRGVAKTGGLVGIGYWEGALCDVHPRAVAEAIVHVRDVAGIEHVALGSDYDGSVAVAFDTADLALITQALLDAGLSEADIRKVMGDNLLRVLASTLPR